MAPKRRNTAGKKSSKKSRFTLRKQTSLVLTLAVAFMMLVVPLSSYLSDDFSSYLGDGTEDSIELPGDYTVKYYRNGEDNDPTVKNYGVGKESIFAYAIPLPSEWISGDKIFAGWSTEEITDATTADLIDGKLDCDGIIYDVYDDIDLKVLSESIRSIDLYAIWLEDVDEQYEPENKYLYSVYLKSNSNGSGKSETDAVGNISDAYAKLDPDGSTTTNRIVVCGNYNITGTESVGGSENGTLLGGVKATICGNGEDAELKFYGPRNNIFLMLQNDTVFEKIKLSKDCVQAFIYCAGNNLTMGEGMDLTSLEKVTPRDDGTRGNEHYAIPEDYPGISILGGGYVGKMGNSKTDVIKFDDLKTSLSPEFTIKLLSGIYGRVSGFGRSYEDINTGIEALCPTIIVSDDARVGTLAAGHLDSDATTGFSGNDLNIAKLIIRANDDEIEDYTSINTTKAVVYLVGGNIGNSVRSTFIGNVDISIYSGKIDYVYGAGLGRVSDKPKTDNAPQTSMSGKVSIFMCDGTITETLYGGGAAAALSGDYANDVNTVFGTIDSSIHITLSGGTITNDVFGGGYGASSFIASRYYKGSTCSLTYEQLQAGTVEGNIEIVISNGAKIEGSVYGGGSGAEAYEGNEPTGKPLTTNSAEVIGNTSVTISGSSTTIGGNVYGGGKGLAGSNDVAKLTGDATVEISGGTITGNIYGGGEFATVYGTTSVTVEGTDAVSIGGNVYGGGKGDANQLQAGNVSTGTDVTISGGTIKGNIYGGGELGTVGNLESDNDNFKLSGGTAQVSISGGIIEGDVFGGGKGKHIDTTNDMILGSVGNGSISGTDSITVQVKIEGTPEIGGSVYGGGELGLVGTCIIYNAGEDHYGYKSNYETLEFTGSSVKVEITGGTIYKNVYGGGMGCNDSNIAGTVGNTDVTISGGQIGLLPGSETSDPASNDEDTRVVPEEYTTTIPEDWADVETDFEALLSVDTTLIVVPTVDDYGEILLTVSGTVITPNESTDDFDAYVVNKGAEITFEFVPMVDSGYRVLSWKNNSVEGGEGEDNSNQWEYQPPEDTKALISLELTNYYCTTIVPLDNNLDNKHGIILTILDTNLEITVSKNEYNFWLEYGTIFKLVYNPGETEYFIGDWSSSGSDILYVENDPNTAISAVLMDTTIQAILAPSIGNVYGGCAYGGVGSAVVDLNPITNHKIISSPQNSESKVTITGGTIGVDTDLFQTGNVYGGGYGPRAAVAGKTTVNICADGDNEIIIKGNVYGGGEMGSVGIPDSDESGNFIEKLLDRGLIKDETPNKSDIGTNVMICATNDGEIFIGKNDAQKYTGSVYGGGKGTVSLFNSSHPDPSSNPDSSSNTIDYGYAAVYGTTNVTISGNVGTNEIPLVSVYGGGEGIILAGENNESTKALTPIQLNSISHSVKYGQVFGYSIDDSWNKADVQVSIKDDVIIRDYVFGGGKLGIVGSYTNNDEDGTYSFDGKKVSVEFSGTLYGNIYGGGKGHTANAISGAVGDTFVVIEPGAEIGYVDEGGQNHSEIPHQSSNGLMMTPGNVYGGGNLAVVGDFTIRDLWKIEDSTHDAKATVVVSGGTIFGSVYGGGFSPIATVVGSTYVYIGFEVSTEDSTGFSISETITTIKGSVYGGGEMAPVGSRLLLDGDSGHLKSDELGTVSTNVKISGDVLSNNILDNAPSTNILGSVYGGGKGAAETIKGYTVTSGDLADPKLYHGYAEVRGCTHVDIDGKGSSEGVYGVYIKENVYGGGKGIEAGINSISYAKVHNHTYVNITDAEIDGSVYGGGELGIIGNYVDSAPDFPNERFSDELSLIINGVYFEHAVLCKPNDPNGDLYTDEYEIYVTDNSSDKFKLDESNTKEIEKLGIIETYRMLLDDNGPVKINVFYRDFCGDDIVYDGSSYEDDANNNKYYASGETTVNIIDSEIKNNVFGGGKGASYNVLVGAVGRGTDVYISGDTNIEGSAYGGGELGIIGSVRVQITNTGTFSSTKAVRVIHVSSVDSLKNNADLNELNDVVTRVTIESGTIKGSVFGAGFGEECNYESDLTDDYKDEAIAYYKLSVFGRTEVNITGGEIYNRVYGGSENGDVGNLTLFKNIKEYVDDYWSDKSRDTDGYGTASGIPTDDRDNPGDYTEYFSRLNEFNASFINLAGGTIYGNVFGGGYFGAIYGNTHVNIGFNAVETCYGSDNLPQKIESEKTPDSIDEKETPLFDEGCIKSNLFINGSVYGGGDRGNPDTVDYDYISVYGNTNILIDGMGYNTGVNSIDEDSNSMYIHGSIFGSGNSCTTFHTDKDLTRVINISNYVATNNYVVYSIQRATNVTLTNSQLRLPGRSDGSNTNTTALYSINHVHKLTMQSNNADGSRLVLDTTVNDLRGIYSEYSSSIINNGSYMHSDESEKYTSALGQNTIQLNNGIILTIAKIEDSGHAFGKVFGYFYLDLENPSYYGGYVYGFYNNKDGGFLRGDSLGDMGSLVQYTDISIVSGRESISEDFSANGYRVWGVGENHIESSVTLVASDADRPVDDNDPNAGFSTTTGSAYLPITVEGAKYKLIGFTVYPDQATKGADKSLNLLSVSGGVTDPKSILQWNNDDPNSYFGLSVETGAGFGEDDSSFLWLDSSSIMEEQFTSKITSSNTLPELVFTLYHKNISKTGAAGIVEFVVQEQIPIDDTETRYGNEIKILVQINTEKQIDDDDFEGDVTLYTSKEGFYDWTFMIPSSKNNTKYELYLESIKKLSGDINFTSDEDQVSTSDFLIAMTPSISRDNSIGWDGYTDSVKSLSLNSKEFYLGTTDGRIHSSLYFTLLCEKGKSIDEYKTGSFDIHIKAYKLDANGNRLTDDSNEDVCYDWTINVTIGKRLLQYYVYFNTVGGSSIPTQFVDENTVAARPDTDPICYDNDNGHPFSFLGWYTGRINDDGSIAYDAGMFDFKTPITNDITLYAMWGYRITYNSNASDATSIEPTMVKANEPTMAPASLPSRVGYTFTNWYTKSTCDDDPFIFGSPLTDDITLYAGWDGKENTLSYDIEGDLDIVIESFGVSPPESGSVKSGGTVTLDAPTGLDNNNSISVGTDSVVTYYFIGWTYEGRTYNAGDMFTIPAKDGEIIVLTAEWSEEQKYIVSIAVDPSIISEFEYNWVIDGTTTGCTYPTNKQFLVGAGSNVSINIDTSNLPDGVATCEVWVGNDKQTDSIEIVENTEIIIKFTLDTYTIRLDLNGGNIEGSTDPVTVETTDKGKYGGLSDYEKILERDGYAFSGWYTAAETGGTEVSDGDSIIILDNHILYARWIPNSYTVVFDKNVPDGAEVKGDMNNQAFVYDVPQNLISNQYYCGGYTFLGWSIDKDVNTPTFPDGDSVTIGGILPLDYENGGVFTLYAVWKINTLIIDLEFDICEYDGYGQLPKIAIGESYLQGTIIYDPLQGNIDDLGEYEVTWTLEGREGNLDTKPIDVGTYRVTVVSGNEIGSATFNITPYTGELYIEMTKTYDSTADLPEINVYMGKDKSGYQIPQSELESLFNISYKIGDTPLDSAPIYAGSYTVTLTAKDTASNFDSNLSGSGEYIIDRAKLTIKVSESCTVEYNGTTSFTLSASNGHIQYDGLKGSDGVVEGEIIIQTNVPGAIDKIDVFSEYNGTIKIMRGDDDVTSNYDIEITGSIEITKKPITFTGESASKRYTGSEIEITGITVTGLISGHRYEGLTYSAKGIEMGTYEGIFPSESSIVIYANDNDVTTNYDITCVEGTLTITPSSSTPTYKLEYNINGGAGTVPATEYYAAGTAVTIQSGDISRTGYTFKGWCDLVSGTTYQANDSLSMPSRNVYLTALWDENSSAPSRYVTVSFISDNESYATIVIAEGSSLGNSMPSNPEKQGYDFIGWYTADGKEITSESILTSDTTVYAKWELNKDYVLVTFVIDNEIYLTQATRIGATTTPPEIQNKLGKQLSAWYSDKELTVEFDFNKTIESSTTLYAEWKNTICYAFLLIIPIMLIIILLASAKRISFFMKQGDEEAYESVIIIGRRLKDKLPEVSDSNFKGWYTEEGEEVTSESKVTRGLKIYARWDE